MADKNKLEVIMQDFEDLTEDEQDNTSDNGGGKKYAGYIRVTYEGKTILLESDAMEREDAKFHRDLSWIKDIIQDVYELGKKENKND
jgi:hypothetical protein